MRNPLIILLLSCFLLTIKSTAYTAGKLLPASQENQEIPFEMVNDLIIIQAEVNGVFGKFLFDNGFSKSALNDDFAKRAGVNFNKSVNIRDINGKTAETGEAKMKEVKIGKHIFQGTNCYLIDTKKFFPCDSLDGVIGASIINKINWKIDFENLRIQLSPKEFMEEGVALKIKISKNNSSFVPLHVLGKSLKFKIDMGNSSEFSIGEKDALELFRKQEVDERIGVNSLSAHGLSGITKFYYLSQAQNLRYSKSFLPIKGKFNFKPHLKYDGYVGVGYFKKYLLVINSLSKKMILASRQNQEKDDIKKSYGLALYLINGEWKIIQLNPNEIHLKKEFLMKNLLEIDDKPLSYFPDFCSYKTYMHNKIDKEEDLILRLKDSNERIIIPYKLPKTVLLN